MITDTHQTRDALRQLVERHLPVEVGKIVEQEANAAAKRVKERVMELAGTIAANVVATVDAGNPFSNGAMDFIVRIRER